jgi:peptidoglycan/LPS O-acetylase OafA/YrhL
LQQNLKALDGIRGLAAFYVFVHHARLGLSQPFFNGLVMHPEKYTWYDKIMVYAFGLFKYGHEAVIVFFVLSGFVIHLKQAEPGYRFLSFDKLAYFKKRIIRIYPTLLVSFLLCVVVDYLIFLISGQDLKIIFSKYHLSNFLYNLFLIPESPIWGYNFPMWSLKHEWFFYLLYPFLLWLSTKKVYFPLIIIFLLFGSYTLGYSIPFIGAAAYTIMVWSLGCILAYYYKNHKSNLINYFPYLLVIICVYPFINREDSKMYPLLDMVFGLIMVGNLSIVLIFRSNFINKTLAKFAWLGSFSFSIYLLHSPLIDLFRAIAFYYQKNTVLPYHQWYILLAVSLITPIIYLIYYFTERKAILYKSKIITS